MKGPKASLRLGAGAGFAGDRIDPAEQLVRHGNLDYLVFECLGERTVAAAQARRLKNPTLGYDPLLERRMRAVLGIAVSAGTRIVTNSGAANPAAAAELVAQIASDICNRPVRIAAVSGDDVLDKIRALNPVLWETGRRLSEHKSELVSANAYLGAAPVVEALEQEADVVITGRLADPALYLGPLVHEFQWDWDDYASLGAGTAVGHLLECAGQLTGGYYADPVVKPVKGMATLGFPYADVQRDGTAVFSKIRESGGILNARTCTEQLLYEVGDPAHYLTPDVTADFTAVTFDDLGNDRVALAGATGAGRPDELKVTLGFKDGWMGEGEISYAGPRALDRAKMAGDIVTDRLRDVHGFDEDDILVELIGTGAAFRGLIAADSSHEVRLRVAAKASTEEAADTIGWEVESLYTNGPAAGGGARRSKSEVLSVQSCLVPRHLLTPNVQMIEVSK